MNKLIIDREQLEALMRLLVDDGHMTPVATMQITKVLDEVPTPDGFLWRPTETSNRWNFTKDPMRRHYPKDSLFAPVVFTAPAIRWGDLADLLAGYP